MKIKRMPLIGMIAAGVSGVIGLCWSFPVLASERANPAYILVAGKAGPRNPQGPTTTQGNPQGAVNPNPGAQGGNGGRMMAVTKIPDKSTPKLMMQGTSGNLTGRKAGKGQQE